jgi:simple sugar transport system ATP-binding protein
VTADVTAGETAGVTYAARPPEALALRDVDKRFGGSVALDGASLVVRRGTVHAVLGENGAGKTTLMRVAFGMVRADRGELRIDGTVRRFTSPAEAIAAGIGMVHQHFSIVPTMTVAENVALGGRGRYDARAAAERVREVGARTGLVLDPAAIAGALAVSGQQRLEIVKALARDARTLILDEPTAVLTPVEGRELLTWLRGFVAGGNTAILVTHRLRDALAYADEITVLRRGRTVGTLDVGEATEAQLAELVLGEPPTVHAEGRGGAVSEIVARSRDVGYVDGQGVARVRGATFDVRAGEIVGIAAVEGAGQHELLRLLAGRLVPTTGLLERPAQIGFIPEDRHRDALLLDAPAVENVALHGAGARRGRMPWRAIAERTASLVESFDVRGGGTAAPVRSLSGGNQQKLIVARELAAAGAAPPLVVAENPTRGLDVRAAAAVHARLRAARDAGTGVVVHSTDLDEVLALADRVLVMYAGHLTATPADREAVGRAMLGASSIATAQPIDG